MWIRKGANAVCLATVARIYLVEKGVRMRTVDGNEAEFDFDSEDAAEKAFKGVMNSILAIDRVLDIRADGTVVS